MDIKKVNTYSPIDKVSGPQGPRKSFDLDKASDGSFKNALDQISNNEVIKSTLPTEAPKGVKFSSHAVERMNNRGIFFSPEDIGKLNQAVEKAAGKGAKDSLVLMNDTALIVSVKNNTVVTVMDKAALKENVFTNIDSTIVM